MPLFTYSEYVKIQNYIVILETAIESLNRKVNELQTALDLSQTEVLELERENQELRRLGDVRSV